MNETLRQLLGRTIMGACKLDSPLEKTEPPKEEPSIVVPLALIISGVVLAGGGSGLHAWVDDQNGTWAAQGLSEAEAQARVDSLNADASGGLLVRSSCTASGPD